VERPVTEEYGRRAGTRALRLSREHAPL
jgi:hypothetical protein